MNILHVIESLDPALGGPSVSSLSLAAAQATLSHDVTIICYKDFSSKESSKNRNDSIPNFSKVNIIYIDGYDNIIEKLLAIKAAKELETHIKNADIIQIHGVWRPVLFKACQLAKKHYKKYVVTPRGMLDPWSLSQNSIKKKIGMLLGWRKVLNDCAYIHALNQSEKDLLSPLKLNCNVNVLPNGFFEEFFNKIPDKGNFYLSHPELNKRPYILFLSRLHYKKGLDYLAEAFALFCRTNKDIDLVVAGPDGGELKKFEAVVCKNNISHRVFITGPLYGEDKFSALVDAFCFTLPSRQEGFSMAIIEALACSTPVVISENCHFPEVETAGAGYIVNLDAQSISNAWENLALDSKKRELYSDAAKKLVLENYLWETIADDVVEKYREILSD